MSVNDMWDLLEESLVSRETLDVVTAINGYNEETMRDVLYAVTGYQSFDQFEEYEL